MYRDTGVALRAGLLAALKSLSGFHLYGRHDLAYPPQRLAANLWRSSAFESLDHRDQPNPALW